MACVGDACSVLADCLYDSACGWGQLCYRGGLLRPAGAMGECLGCELGCRCGDPGCPCLDGTSQLPCQAACPVAGIWEGTFTGYLVSGTWRMWVETTGVGVGFHQGMGHGHPFSGPLSGAITATGQVDFVATGSGSATCPWTGTFTASSGSGTWSCGASDHGMWSGNLKGPLSPFRGSWSGVFEGPETGVWEVTVDAAGTVAGSVSGQTASGPYSVAVQGAVSASGSARLVATGSGVLSGCAWSGTFAGRTASGQWSCPGPGPEGVWRGSWQGGSYPAPRS
jgi:hypothetical protein